MNRILTINNLDDARRELHKIKVSSQGVEVMAPKCLVMSIKLTNIHIGAANILKQEMLSIGGDAAVARGVVNGIEKCSDVILLGNADKIKKLIRKLDYQEIFGLPNIKSDLQKMLNSKLKSENNKISLKHGEIDLSNLNIMGILNVTPDSFSDGSEFYDVDKAVEHAFQMEKDGADIIDIGGESTRPGAEKVNVQKELDRVIPVIEKIRKKSDIPISIDSYKSIVAKQALMAGADMINDISALRFDEEMIDILKENPEVPVILMHMLGTPETMQKDPFYDEVIEEILDFFEERIGFCKNHNVDESRLIIDPGIGFGKRQEDNLTILKKLAEFRCFGVPVLMGASRKSFIGRIYDSIPAERLEGSLATTALALEAGINFIRVHDVKEHKRFVQVWQETRRN
ncbi:MAG: dihydropteroate synthase [Candidatus Cloacimonetes bacterium]|nr:dihydropteroate synthase [Candidatus Cloacimonadota bacterium]MCF7813815.1 dihydropteroate synthase [Candidatus Cloacimonadota bacterium]MCF7868494.1 dihydropteroate synthase [Candidatus Cloacimonadota bacterium]